MKYGMAVLTFAIMRISSYLQTYTHILPHLLPCPCMIRTYGRTYFPECYQDFLWLEGMDNPEKFRYNNSR